MSDSEKVPYRGHWPLPKVMIIFDDEAVADAGKAIEQTVGMDWPSKDCAKAALEAAVLSLRERGKLSQGSYKLYGAAGAGSFDFGNLNFFKGDCDYAIIRMEKRGPPPWMGTNRPETQEEEEAKWRNS